MHYTLINLFLLLVFPEKDLDSGLVDCDLQKTFETSFLTAKYSSSWRAYHYGGGHTLMYYEDSNFDRREDAEISFSREPIPANIKFDSIHIASRLAEYHARVLQNDPKIPPGTEIKNGGDTIEVINGEMWYKSVLLITATENNVRREFENSYYVRLTPKFLYGVTLGYLLPKIPTVEREFPCIIRSIRIKE